MSLRRARILACDLSHYWKRPAADLMQELGTSAAGIMEAEAPERLKIYGLNLLQSHKRLDALGLLLAQFKSPIVIILICAAILSYLLDSRTEAIIILVIVLLSSLLSFWQEYGAVRRGGKASGHCAAQSPGAASRH